MLPWLEEGKRGKRRRRKEEIFKYPVGSVDNFKQNSKKGDSETDRI